MPGGPLFSPVIRPGTVPFVFIGTPGRAGESDYATGGEGDLAERTAVEAAAAAYAAGESLGAAPGVPASAPPLTPPQVDSDDDLEVVRRPLHESTEEPAAGATRIGSGEPPAGAVVVETHSDPATVAASAPTPAPPATAPDEAVAGACAPMLGAKGRGRGRGRGRGKAVYPHLGPPPATAQAAAAAQDSGAIPVPESQSMFGKGLSVGGGASAGVAGPTTGPLAHGQLGFQGGMEQGYGLAKGGWWGGGAMGHPAMGAWGPPSYYGWPYGAPPPQYGGGGQVPLVHGHSASASSGPSEMGAVLQELKALKEAQGGATQGNQLFAGAGNSIDPGLLGGLIKAVGAPPVVEGAKSKAPAMAAAFAAKSCSTGGGDAGGPTLGAGGAGNDSILGSTTGAGGGSLLEAEEEDPLEMVRYLTYLLSGAAGKEQGAGGGAVDAGLVGPPAAGIAGLAATTSPGKAAPLSGGTRGDQRRVAGVVGSEERRGREQFEHEHGARDQAQARGRSEVCRSRGCDLRRVPRARTFPPGSQATSALEAERPHQQGVGRLPRFQDSTSLVGLQRGDGRIDGSGRVEEGQGPSGSVCHHDRGGIGRQCLGTCLLNNASARSNLPLSSRCDVARAIQHGPCTTEGHADSARRTKQQQRHPCAEGSSREEAGRDSESQKVDLAHPVPVEELQRLEGEERGKQKRVVPCVRSAGDESGGLASGDDAVEKPRHVSIDIRGWGLKSSTSPTATPPTATTCDLGTPNKGDPKGGVDLTPTGFCINLRNYLWHSREPFARFFRTHYIAEQAFSPFSPPGILPRETPIAFLQPLQPRPVRPQNR